MPAGSARGENGDGPRLYTGPKLNAGRKTQRREGTYPTGPGPTLCLGMVEKPQETNPAGRLLASADALAAALEEAQRELAGGEALEAERRAKAVSALVRAARDAADLQAYARAQAPEEDEDALRAELRDRLARFIAAADAGAPDEVLERIGAGEIPA